jgi:hypothetical protein
MSSFFTVPASQRKRKRDDRNAAPTTKKRGVDAKNDAGSRRAQEREESISGSDLDEDENGIVSGGSGEDSESDSDDGETAGDRRLKLAERYLDNIREEVDEVGFDAAEIDRDLIAERLKEDVVRGYHIDFSCDPQILKTITGRIQGSYISSNRFQTILPRCSAFFLPLRYPDQYFYCRSRALRLHR